jgi:hypothetical protein
MPGFEQSHADLMTNIEAFALKIAEYRLSIKAFLDSLFGSGELFDSQGLQLQLGCSWVGEEIRKTMQGLCASMAPNVLKISFFIAGIGYLSCCLMNCAFFANRHLVVKPT